MNFLIYFYLLLRVLIRKISLFSPFVFCFDGFEPTPPTEPEDDPVESIEKDDNNNKMPEEDPNNNDDDDVINPHRLEKEKELTKLIEERDKLTETKKSSSIEVRIIQKRIDRINDLFATVDEIEHKEDEIVKLLKEKDTLQHQMADPRSFENNQNKIDRLEDEIDELKEPLTLEEKAMIKPI